MNPLAVALAWAGAGVFSALVLPRVRLRRLGVITPLAGLLAVLLAGAGHGSAATSSVLGEIDRTHQGLLVLGAAALTVALALAPSLRGGEALTIGVVGGATALAVSSSSLALRSLALLIATSSLALSWIGASPGRRTLAAGRVPAAGVAALLAAAVFLPLPASAAGARPIVVGILLAGGIATLIGLLPLGGWAAAGYASLRGIDVAPWQLLVAPAALLTAEAIPQTVPAATTTIFEQALLATGLLTAVWNGLLAARTPAAGRYGRVLIADLGLAAAALGGGRGTAALAGALLLLISHAVLAPLLLPGAEAPMRAPVRAAWALLSGVPPSLSFWGRFLVLEALVQADPATLFAAVPALVALFLAAVLAALPPAGVGRAGAVEHPILRDLIGWVLVATALAAGLVPETAASFVFGGG